MFVGAVASVFVPSVVLGVEKPMLLDATMK